MENWISLLVVPYTIAPFGMAILTKQSEWIVLGVLVFMSIFSTTCIKRLTEDLPYSWLKRPNGASNCNTSLTDGDQSGAPGFPSGHCACTATFWVGVWFLTSNPYRFYVGIIGSICIMSMIWARHKKRCHSLVQTIAGTVLGTGFAFLL